MSTDVERFQKHCGRGSLLLQAQLIELRRAHPYAVVLWRSRSRLPKSMTVRRADDRHLLTRITTRLDPPEELREIDPGLAQALSRAGLTLIDGRLSIPNEGNLDFTSKVMDALRTTLGLPAGEEGPLRAGTVTTFWDSLEKLTGSIEAPRDWSAEHDHYLYGVPRRNKDGGE